MGGDFDWARKASKRGWNYNDMNPIRRAEDKNVNSNYKIKNYKKRKKDLFRLEFLTVRGWGCGKRRLEINGQHYPIFDVHWFERSFATVRQANDYALRQVKRFGFDVLGFRILEIESGVFVDFWEKDKNG